MIFDTHAHYDDHRFDLDREELLASLPKKHVGAVVNAASSMESVRTTLDLALSHEWIYAAVGVHPDSVSDLSESDMETLREIVSEHGPGGTKNVVAIGEIGLDYAYEDGTPKPLQREWFRRQLALSNELRLPVIVHSRDAANETYETVKEMKTGEDAGIIHCFSYAKEMAKRFIDLGYAIGLGGVVTFKNGRVAKEVAAYVPLDRLVLETDAPYLAPTPFRGQRNDSSLLSYVAEEIARLRRMDPRDVIETCAANARRIYRIGA